jgi:large subunit ribosomal protein L10
VNKREKEQVVSELREKLEAPKTLILTDYRGLNVEEITRLRRRLKEASVEYRVVKNRLMLLALKETNLEQLSDLFVGPTAMALTREDPLAPAKVLLEFSKETPMLEIKGGFVEGRVVGPIEIEAMAKLPGREVLLANLLRLFKGGQFRLVGVLSAQLRKLVQVVEAIHIARRGEEESKEEVEEEAKAEVEVKEEVGEEVKAKAEVEVKEEVEEETKAEVEAKEEVEEEAKAEVEVKEEAEEEVKAEVEVKEEVGEEVKAKAEAEVEVKEETKKEAKKEPKKEESKKEPKKEPQ